MRDTLDAAAALTLRLALRAREQLASGVAPPRIGRHAALDVEIRRSLDGERRLLEDLRLARTGATMLSIGPGAGFLEIELMARHGMQLGYVEPHLPSCARLEEGLRAAGLADRVGERHTSRFETCRLRDRYDLVLSVNSWYPFAKSRALLRTALRALRPGGWLYVSLASERDFLRRTLATHPRLTPEDLSQWADREGFPHRLIHFEETVPTHALVEDRELTPIGRDWLAFMAGGAWEDLSAERRELVRRYVLERASHSRVVRDRAALVFGPRDP